MSDSLKVLILHSVTLSANWTNVPKVTWRIYRDRKRNEGYRSKIIDYFYSYWSVNCARHITIAAILNSIF